ncbi:MAG: hypothetical protein A3J65_00690 [Candidatus Buchananbacteria bacterium RIFCSPHIGHO2_02_FULL_45_11b]|uniref:DUF192 domain-containing protein n=4 Tax=Candidatus Buchananiibacteriota TaxID=1817903 RepID=A0A1G1Y873_9BACT|nr:MAG: hypothetical protein A2663_02060 [Candidatus Buchananbacteria bacterium RIFCSPHIGHO2_01_FULL_46_12]OGY52375.1 MAG: hypothetical protein A3J65_00690 [Candidatus Buchananbacteria bacterium RIFCSPHIGHO2_02_FULL_45_11b]OGY53213.1 MAG: hypothetical protein A3B15_02945 [Candidatus Buchananbacteria bacterium RIFCSPLOWO2_01_FULL_45_31]OGY56095.1 MAG: hypothetical protein A3H67_04620 [Candidatus Buchananbacteria bacterium RIFCSPLOWO2_02_FULL_46_11b]
MNYRKKIKTRGRRLRIIACLILPIIFFGCQPSEGKIIRLGETEIKVKVAKTPDQQIKGFSSQDGLAEDEGLLFIYPDRQTRGIWMKEMKFDIDIIWLDDYRVIGFEENAPFILGTSKIYYSPKPVNQILEVGAGFVKEHQIGIGQILTIPGK